MERLLAVRIDADLRLLSDTSVATLRKTRRRWARRPDNWWRRAALVATVPLNVKSQGGRGDVSRAFSG